VDEREKTRKKERVGEREKKEEETADCLALLCA